MTKPLNNLVELLLYQSEHLPNRTAYTFLKDGEVSSISITYLELRQKVLALAADLQTRVTPGDRVLILYPSGIDFIIAFLGCLCAKVIAVPAYPPRRNQRLGRLCAIINDAEPSFVLTTHSLLQSVSSHLEALTVSHIPCLATDHLGDKLANTWILPKVNEDTTAFLQYTSGSTGNPKGVMVSHRNLLYNEKMIQSAFQNDETTVYVSWLPLFHDMGLIGNVLQSLYLGSSCILMSPTAFLQKPIRWLQAISDYQGTTSGAPNFAYDLCVNRITAEQRANLDLSGWKIAFNGSEPIRAETLQRFSETFAESGFQPEAVHPCYGMAEATLIISGGGCHEKPIIKNVETSALEKNQILSCDSPQQNSRSLVGCGHTLLEQKIAIVDPHSQQLSSPQQVGEIWVSGPNVAQGYWQRQQETCETFQAYIDGQESQPYLRTGDLGFLDEEGNLFVTGRLKEVIVIHGRNYYPQDIELIAERSHPALRPHSGAAFSVEIDGEERLIIAHEVERSYLRRINISEIAGAVRKAISEEFDLAVYTILLLRTNTLPKTSSGKIQRRGCRQAFLNKTLKVVGQDQIKSVTHSDQSPPSFSQKTQFNAFENLAPRELQQWLVTEVAQRLEIDPAEIKLNRPLTEYGLSSVEAMVFSGDLQEKFGSSLPVTLIYDYPTIHSLSQYLHQLASNTDALAPELGQSLDLNQEAVLDPTIQPCETNPEDISEPQAIFLSGATGFLGAFLLDELLRHTQADVYCLVRADKFETARKRVEENLKKYELWQDQYQKRIIPILGEITQPQLGLDDATFSSLANTIDTIYHGAAELNFVSPYTSLKPANVTGTQEIIRLASLGKTKALHYISTVAVLEARAYRGQVVTEFDPLDSSEGMYMGYSQSKWVAEKLVRVAQDRGLPACIYRPSLIAGDSRSGIWNTDDFSCRFFKGCIQLGSFPDLDLVFDLTPVDYVARAIALLSSDSNQLGKTFHLQHPEPILWTQVMGWIRDFGYYMEELPYQKWVNQLLNQIRSSTDNALSSLAPFFTRRWGEERLTVPELYTATEKTMISCKDTIQTIRQISNLSCPNYQPQLFESYFSYFQCCGFISSSQQMPPIDNINTFSNKQNNKNIHKTWS